MRNHDAITGRILNVVSQAPVSAVGIVFSDREREVERSPLARFRNHPDSPAVAVHDPLADRQADARAVVLFAGVQAAEDIEDLPWNLASIPMPLSRTENCQQSSSRQTSTWTFGGLGRET